MFLKPYNYLPLLFISTAYAQTQPKDSITDTLNELVINSFQKTIPYLENTTSVARINQQILNSNNPERLVDAVNLIAGTKMEERSPGSYRLSLRGSTIRSPFGVRNVKIYWDDFILTDATGNSYLNSIEPDFINEIQVMKGPQGGEMGTETGGVMILKSHLKNETNATLTAGSYNQLSEKINFSKTLGAHHLTVGQSHYQSNGYRQQSAMKRTSFYLNDLWKYNTKNTINFKAFYTNLGYETPGGLTREQMLLNRKQARLATATLPSAETQNATIYNKTFLGGMAHIWNINKNWTQFSLIQTSFTNLKNPFISNFEERKEFNVQGRFYVNHEREYTYLFSRTRFGFEAGTNKTDFNNYDNNAGIKGNPQKFDRLKTNSAFYYVSQHFAIKNTFYIDASLSLQQMKYGWKTTFPNVENGNKAFKNQLLPNIALSYKITPSFSLRGKVSKGNSSPTTEEIRSSNRMIAQDLVPEFGWNKEIGIRKKIGSIFIETTLFHYQLKDAIVKRQDQEGNDYFINAGGTKQLGLEFTVESQNYTFEHSVLNQLHFLVSGNLYDFKYDAYQVNNVSYTNHQLPGISKFSMQSLINVELFYRFQLNFSNFFNSSMYLNDANTVKEKQFIVGHLKLDTNFKINKIKSNAFFGINNLYNTKYSSGYDLNAFGNRYYNPAATRNFYIGMKIIL